MIAIYPGSFDPLTYGHLDILDRSLKLFSKVIIVVAGAGHKTALLTPEERVELIRKAVKGRKGVEVDTCSGLIMEYARKRKISAVIRGLRAASDFEYEFMMASMNKNINRKVETVFMMTSQNLYFVSSSMIKELYKYGGDISPYVPKPVFDRLHKLKNKNLKTRK